MGHMVEYLQGNIWIRFQKLRGHECTYICASDVHGTPVMLKARDSAGFLFGRQVNNAGGDD